jgi:hypothetical protein
MRGIGIKSMQMTCQHADDNCLNNWKYNFQAARSVMKMQNYGVSQGKKGNTWYFMRPLVKFIFEMDLELTPALLEMGYKKNKGTDCTKYDYCAVNLYKIVPLVSLYIFGAQVIRRPHPLRARGGHRHTGYLSQWRVSLIACETSTLTACETAGETATLIVCETATLIAFQNVTLVGAFYDMLNILILVSAFTLGN